MSNWQPIETAPKDGTEVIVFEANFPKVIFIAKMGRQGIGVWDWMTTDGDVAFPAYWMPLPKPPIA